MLSVEQAKNQQLYSLRNGMRNVAWQAGILRNRTKTDGYIQQTNNLNQMIHFRCEEGVVIPDEFSNGQAIKIIARMLVEEKNGRPSIVLEVKQFNKPSILDMPARKAWEQVSRSGVPIDPNTPSKFREDNLDGWRVEDAGNTAHLAGYVAGFWYEPPKQPGGGCVEILIRQVKDETDRIPVRHYGKAALAIYRRLEIGMPLLCQGRVSVGLKNTGEPAGEDGILPTHKTQYLRVPEFKLPSNKDLIWTEYPDWVVEMINKSHAIRAQKREESQRRRAEAIEEDLSQRTAQAVIPVDPETQTVATATASSRPGTAEVPVDVLELVRGL